MASPLGLEDRRAVVVGGGFGIGREVCLLLGGFGAHVAVVDLDLSRAEAVRDEVALVKGVDVIDDSYQDFGAGQFIWRLGDPAVEGYVAASDSRRDGQAAGW